MPQDFAHDVRLGPQAPQNLGAAVAKVVEVDLGHARRLDPLTPIDDLSEPALQDLAWAPGRPCLCLRVLSHLKAMTAAKHMPTP